MGSEVKITTDGKRHLGAVMVQLLGANHLKSHIRNP